MKNYRSTLEPDGVYHVYNRAHGKEKLFIESTNYHYFLKLFKEYIHPIAEVYAYCLMPNHFHVLLKIKSEEELNDYFNVAWARKSEKSRNFSTERKITQQFSNFFNAYTKAYNKFYGRLGGLFISNYRRIKIESDRQFINTVKYIHFNPVNARISKRPEEWSFSSYKAFICHQSSLIEKEYVINSFGDLENFIFMHRV
jgi:REP element-mobilizing transposase RayT